MQLTISTKYVRHAMFTNESGQLLYKTTHPRLVPLGTTTLHKVKPNDDPMDMRDQFDVIGEIEWHLIGSTKFRFDGKETPANEFLAPRGVLRQFVVVLDRFFSDSSFYIGRARLLDRMVAHISGRCCFLTQ